MKSTIVESLNKGVPVDTPVLVRYNDLLGIVDDKEKLKSIIDKKYRRVFSVINRTNLPVVNLSFYKTFEIYTDPKNLERSIVFSPTSLTTSILANLNYRGMGESLEHRLVPVGLNEEEILSRLRKLRSIKTEKQLAEEFPFLYRYSYIPGCNYYKENDFGFAARFVDFVCKDELVKKRYLDDLKRRYKQSGIFVDVDTEIKKARFYRIENFGNAAANTIATLLDNKNFEFNREFLLDNPIDLSEVVKFDQDKLELYFAYCFLEFAKIVNPEDKQRYLYYVSNYFMENKDKISSNLCIAVGVKDENSRRVDKSKLVSSLDLYTEYKKLLVDNPNLRVIDFSKVDFSDMSLSEVEGFMDLYLKDLGANWEIISSLSVDEEFATYVRSKIPGRKREDTLTHRERLVDLFLEKKEFYDSCDPFFRIKGKNTFDGYIGYIFKNGKIILDKFYDDAENGKVADGHAIYVMNIDEFYELSRLSKSELIKNKLCTRYIHRGDWQDRVRREIGADCDGYISAADEVKKLVKSGNVSAVDGNVNLLK